MFDYFVVQIKKNCLLIFKYIILLVVLWILNLSVPFLSGLYMDYIVGQLKSNVLFIFVFLIAAANLFHMVFRYFQVIISTRLNNTLTYKISNGLFQKIFKSSYEEYSSLDSAYLVDQISKDSHAVVRFFMNNIVNFFLQVGTILMSAFIIFKADVILSIAIFSLLPFYIITFNVHKEKMYKTKNDYKQEMNIYFSKYSEQITKLSYIKRNVLAQEMEKRFNDAFKKMLNASLLSVRTDYIFMNINQFIIIISYICIIAIGGIKVSAGELSIGYFSIINTYFNMVLHSVSYFLGLAGTYHETMIAIKRINKILNSSEEMNGDVKLHKIRRLDVVNLSIQFDSYALIRNFNFRFDVGYIYGIRGKNGCGKSTFLNTLVGICPGQYEGSIFYDGIELSNLDMQMLRRKKISFLEQEPVMLSMTVEQYLKYGIEMTVQSSAFQEKMLVTWGLSQLKDKEINENGSNLSGGEKKKLALIRCLSKESDLIILDEPTSSLDQDSILVLVNFLKGIKKETIVLVVTHDDFILDNCDQIIDL